MSELEFEDKDTNLHTHSIDISNAVSHNTPLLIKWGVVKNLQQANIVMIALFLTCMVITAIIIAKNIQEDSTLYREDFTQDELNRMLPDMRDSLPSRK